LGCKNVHEALI